MRMQVGVKFLEQLETDEEEVPVYRPRSGYGYVKKNTKKVYNYLIDPADAESITEGDYVVVKVDSNASGMRGLKIAQIVEGPSAATALASKFVVTAFSLEKYIEREKVEKERRAALDRLRVLRSEVDELELFETLANKNEEAAHLLKVLRGEG